MERTILVAEDSPTQAEHLRLLLEGEGYRVDVVTNGLEGWERVWVAPPDLIVSDVVMPQMDGYAFCQAVKSAERTRRIPFVLLTERNTPADFIKGLQHGADNFITKPFQDDYLLERVRRIFENLELRRQGRLDVEITLALGEQKLVINADKQQMIELLFATLEELVRANGRLAEAQRTVEEYARNLEAKVQERTEQLLQTEKLATMGELLAGVAHELNNPLSVLLGQSALLREMAGSGPVAERVEKIAKATERCARIVRNFLTLARQHPLERQRVSLNHVVQEAVELLAYPLRVDNVEVTLNLAPDLPVLWADPHQLHQVVVNLVTNAHHAMREALAPRQLTLTTAHDEVAGRVSLEVADTGPGIPREIQARIFEPFFTTKPPGQGTGLGLSLCQGIIAEHRGSIRAESEPGRGATFIVELPLEAPQLAVAETRAAEARLSVRGKRLLVVDDEPGILSVLAEILSADGHQVDTADNGALALEKLQARAYDLILSDLRMPELDGAGLYREVEGRHPELLRRFVFLTGDTLTPETRRFLERVAAPCLTKPFTPAEAREVTQRALRALLADSAATGAP
ncbi:MAG: response regulator [Candidatus Rokubacteria bacterium]|nr:response regulator [Candidatus Rokubacteria bacterium]